MYRKVRPPSGRGAPHEVFWALAARRTAECTGELGERAPAIGSPCYSREATVPCSRQAKDETLGSSR